MPKYRFAKKSTKSVPEWGNRFLAKVTETDIPNTVWVTPIDPDLVAGLPLPNPPDPVDPGYFPPGVGEGLPGGPIEEIPPVEPPVEPPPTEEGDPVTAFIKPLEMPAEGPPTAYPEGTELLHVSIWNGPGYVAYDWYLPAKVAEAKRRSKSASKISAAAGWNK